MRIEGGSSELMCKFMDVFWSLEGFNFERLGIQIQARLVKLHYGLMILDEKAEKEIFGARGAGATRMCLSCCNVIKTTRPIPAGSTLVPFTETDRSKWEPNTKELMKAAVDYLDTQRLALGANAFETLHQQLGMTHKDCVLVRSRFWDALDPPQKRYTDWFHDLVASGGVMQYIVNQVVYDLNLKGITPEDIDSFRGGVCGLQQKLTPSFFSDRYVPKRRAHISAFGSDVITALDVLC